MQVYLKKQLQSTKNHDAIKAGILLEKQGQANIEHQFQLGKLKIVKQKKDSIINLSKTLNKSPSSSHHSPQNKYFISQFTKTDAYTLHQMMETQQFKQKQLQQQALKLQQKILEEQERQAAIRQLQKKQMVRNRRKQISQGLDRIWSRHKSRKSLSLLENRRLLQVKSQRKLHEKLQEKWQQKEKQLKEMKIQNYQKIIQKKKVDMRKLKQHQRNFIEKLQERKQKIVTSKVSQIEEQEFYQSVFLSRVIDDDILAKKKVFEKELRAKEFAEKRAQYAELVRENYRPQHFKKSQFKDTLTLKPTKSFSQRDLYNQGTTFMREVNQKLPKSRVTKSQFFAKQPERARYTDYLTELKTKKDKQLEKANIQPIPEQHRNKTEAQIDRIMKKKSLSSHQKLKQAKIVIKKFEDMNYKKNPFKVIDSIHAKIEVLKRLNQ